MKTKHKTAKPKPISIEAAICGIVQNNRSPRSALSIEISTSIPVAEWEGKKVGIGIPYCLAGKIKPGDKVKLTLYPK